MAESGAGDQRKWLLIRQLFDQLLDLADSERIPFLDSHNDDSLIRAEVIRMLTSWQKAQTWFDRVSESVVHLAANPVFEPGDLLAARYRINRLIGRGGMGEVYEASDTVLSGSVALKALRPSLAIQESIHATFRKEILLSRIVKSDFICRVHDIETHCYPGGAEIPFFTMELLEGDSLAAAIQKKGRFSLKEARPIIHDMALGLSAAHQMGILHRDFKPGNVMLTPARAVITDFGLALRVSEKTEALNAATPGYASPEQLANSEQTVAADIYSFGVVLYEMLTGRKPANESARDQDVPRIVRQCLSTRPLNRPVSVRLVAERLGAIDTPRKLTRRTAILAPATAILAVAAYRAAHPLGHILSGRNRVLIAPLFTADANAEAARILAVLLARQLGQSEAVNPASSDEVRDAMARIGRPLASELVVEEWRQVALRAGASALVLSSLERDLPSKRSSLGLVLESLGDSTRAPLASEKRSFPFVGDLRGPSANPSLSAAVQEAAVWIRENAGESRSNILASTLPINEVTTHSWEALKEFVAAEHAPDTELQLAHLHSATERDPNFALAWMRLGDLYYAKSRDAEGQAAYHKAMNTVSSRLAPREEFRIRSFIANDQWDYAEADRQFRLWSSRFPSDTSAPLWRISSLLALNRESEAVDVYSALVAKDPENFQAWQFLAISFLFTGQFDRMNPALSRLRDLKKTDLADRWRGAGLFLQGRLTEAIELSNDLLQRAAPAGRLRLAFWMLWYLTRLPDLAPALRYAAEFISLPVPSGAEGYAADLHIGIASLFAVAGRPVSSIVDLLQNAIAWGAGPNHAYRAGVIFARVGERASAQRVLRKYFPAPETVKERLWSIRLQGHIELAGSRYQNSVRLFEQARLEKKNRIEPEWALIVAYRNVGEMVMSRQAQDEYRSRQAFYQWWVSPELLGMHSILS